MIGVALALALQVSSLPPGSQIIGNADSVADATCVAAVGMAENSLEGKTREAGLSALAAFYVGRLSARSVGVEWKETAKRDASPVEASQVGAVLRCCVQRMGTFTGSDFFSGR